MPTYKLHYFNIRGRAEVARLIMAHANVEYEDYRFEFNDFATIKANYPLGQVPVLEVDGKMLAQSRAINRFLAKKYGLAGKDAMEQAKVDMYVDCLEDLIPKIRPAVREYMTNQRNQQDTELVLIHEVAEKHLVPYIQLIEKHLEKNGSGFLVGNSLTWADIEHFSFFSALIEMKPDLLSDVPHFKNLRSVVENEPPIKKYLDTRPKSLI